MENGFYNPVEENPKPHAIFVPYPFQGHVIPSVHLAIKLASRGFTITFLNTHFVHDHISRAHASGPDIFTPVRQSGLDIRYATVSDGLHVGFDRTNVETHNAALLHVLGAHVEEAIAEIVKKAGPPVRFLIADTFFVWPAKLARKFGIKYVSFWTEAALVFSLYYHLDLLRKNRHFGCIEARKDTIDYIPGVRSIEPTDMMSYLQESDTSSMFHKIIEESFNDVRAADIIICNTTEELEPETILALQSKMPFYSIGPILPSEIGKSIVATSLWSESDCSQWLSMKPNGTVLYVSFGSFAHVDKNDLLEIAKGLLLSKISFVWVLRPDIVSTDDTDPLPVGLKKEIGDRGMIIPWCNQIKVLTHPAIGGFLTHCGWNSTLESIWSEVPLLCFPLLTDQFTNQKLVVDDWKIGINLCDKRLINSDKVSEKINHLMSGTTGHKFRKEITEVKKKMENALTSNGSSEQNFDKFIQDLKASIQQ